MKKKEPTLINPEFIRKLENATGFYYPTKKIIENNNLLSKKKALEMWCWSEPKNPLT